jgi:hypothetical protein
MRMKMHVALHIASSSNQTTVMLPTMMVKQLQQ